jgi:hypothetical protein
MGSRLRLLLVVLAVAGVSAAAATSAAPLPEVLAATVVGDRVTLTFSGPLKPRTGAWTVVVNGRPITGSRATVSGKRVQLVLPRPVYGDDTLRVVGRVLRARSGARMRLVDVMPTNRSAAGCSEEVGALTPGRATEGPTDANTFLALGRLELLTVQVDYPDAPSSGGTGDPFQVAAVDSWIRTLSYGRASVGATTHPTVVRLPRTFGEYGHTGSWSARKSLFEDLVRRLDAEVDFSRYDAVVLSSTRHRAGPSRIPTQIDPFALAPVGDGVLADGKELRHFAVAGSLTLLQTLFRLAGIPVLEGGYASGWDALAGPPEPNRIGLLAWHRRKLGWLRPHEVRCVRAAPLEVTLEPTWRPGGVKAVVVPTGRNTALVLENRQRQGLDAGLCGQGILAYEVRTDWQYQLWIIAADRTFDPAAACFQSLPRAAFDFVRGGSRRVGGVGGGATFEVLDKGVDGTYRLRVSR